MRPSIPSIAWHPNGSFDGGRSRTRASLALRASCQSIRRYPRQSVKHVEPCVARGVDADGQFVAVVFSCGVDLDLTPFVADVALSLPNEVKRVLIAAPERDLVAATQDLAGLLDRPVEMAGL